MNTATAKVKSKSAATGDAAHCLTQYAPLVKRVAHHMMAKLPASVEIDDVIQTGMLGLLDAANRYEESHGAQFETYAVQRIRGAILDGLRQADWLPRSFRRDLRRIEAAIGKLEQRLGRAPSELQVAAELGMPLAEYQKMLQEARGYQLISFEDFNHADGGDFLERHCEESGINPLDALCDRKLRERVVKAISGLPEREKVVMGLYYDEELNFREIGETLGVSESRICQLHTQAIARLRSQIRGLFSLEQQAELAASAFARPNRPVASNDMAQGRVRNCRATLMILAETQGRVTDIPLDGAATAQ